MMIYTIYTDGACSGNPGPGGWAFVVLKDGLELYRQSGSKGLTTNNEMELFAVLQSITYIYKLHGVSVCADIYQDSLFSQYHPMVPQHKIKIIIRLDSEYVRKGAIEYINDRKKRGWKTSRNKLIKNVLLRQELYQYIEGCTIEWHWVKGHNGNVYNEVVDLLAVNAIGI